MHKAISLSLLLGGIVLIMFGNNEMNSVSSELSRIFTNAPTDRAIGLIVGGVVMTIAGAAGMFFSPFGAKK